MIEFNTDFRKREPPIRYLMKPKTKLQTLLKNN